MRKNFRISTSPTTIPATTSPAIGMRCGSGCRFWYTFGLGLVFTWPLFVIKMPSKKVYNWFVRSLNRAMYCFRIVVPKAIAQKWYEDGTRKCEILYDQAEDVLIVKPIRPGNRNREASK